MNTELKGDRLLVRAPFEVKDLLKSVPGAKWDSAARAWTYPATPCAAYQVREALRSVHLDLTDGKTLELLLDEMDRAQRVRATPPADLTMPATKTTPMLHQRIAVNLAHALPGLYLAHDMGCGKSWCVVNLSCALKMRAVLVACPSSVVSVWPEQYEAHGDGSLYVYAARDGSVARRKARAEQALSAGPAVVVVNHEAVWRAPFGPWALARDWDLVVVDEAHRLQDPKSKVSKFFHEIAPRARRRLCLSGTPIPNSPLGLWSQCRFLDAGLFGEYWDFKKRYAVMGGPELTSARCPRCGIGHKRHRTSFVCVCGHRMDARPVQVVDFQDLDDMKRRFYLIAHRVTKAECLDLPPVVDQVRHVTLGTAGRSLYNELEATLRAEVESGTVTAANALTKLLRLQQVTGGSVNDDAGEAHEVDSAKQSAVQEWAEDIAVGEPLVVFARFHHDLDAIHKASTNAQRKSYELSGRRDELAAWKADPSGAVLAVQIEAGGLGIDLSRSAYACYFSTGFSWGAYSQSRARLHRLGQARSVTYTHLVAENTVDEQVYETLARKERRAGEVVEDDRITAEVIAAIRGTNGT